MLAQLRNKILISVLLGLAVVVILGLLSDIGQVGQSFSTFDWAMLPAVLGFTLLNYLLRWAKWDYYLRRMGMGQGVAYGDSAL
ncbi:MAG TPA: lysylphosphatidylglycerol synthase domain-containing protein, partial [Roseiflexaceae bacterium]|nr:lysylphosphatidylglycerol synthase domain-containing protein [Roseiflexaceae bacterium]